MRNAVMLFVMLAVFGGVSNAQEKPKAPGGPKPVILKAENYEELYKIEEQIKLAAREEQDAYNVYQGKAAVRAALQQAFESARLRALMALGITDPKTEIAPPPEPEKPEVPAPK